jgi:hypothetical protein
MTEALFEEEETTKYPLKPGSKPYFSILIHKTTHATLLTVSKAKWNRDAKNGRTKVGSTYDKMEVAAATVSERCSSLLYCPRSINFSKTLTK